MYNKNTHHYILATMLAVISLALSLIKIPIPAIPPFLTLDFSFIPLFLGLLLLGYKNSLLISLIKNTLHFLLISHEPIGSIANIIVEVVFITCLIFFYKKGNKGIILGGIIGTISITIVMSVVNYFILLPAYGVIMDLSDIVNNLKVIVTYAIIPFNIIKGFFLIILFFFTKRLLKRIPSSLTMKFK